MTKEYDYVERPFRGDNRKKAWHLKDNHSALDAICCFEEDNNAWDSYANIRDIWSHCFIKVKGERRWRDYHQSGNRVEVDFDYGGEKVRETIMPSWGMYRVIERLELPTVRAKRERKERLDRIRQELRDLQKERKVLLASR